MLRISAMTTWVMWALTQLFQNIGVAMEGYETIARAREVVDAPEAKPLTVTEGRITVENVRFMYGRDVGGVSHVDTVIRPGERVGLIGRSGAGKSSLVNLLLRFYDVEEGRILIDGQDIARVTQDSLRANISVVTQDTALLHRSVMDNILYGRPDASEADAIEAAKRAHAHDFVLDLSDPAGRTGYDAHVGERGVKLSGGQRQRIAIARAILKDAPILVLDEATSALDSEVEAEIQDELADLMQGKTVIAIAHRLSTIAHLDRIVVMDAGRIAEDGTHDTLLERDGLYASFWKRQSGGFLNMAAE
jgi:ATP-binding cassette subfamily B multidrug efflux pump